MKSIQMRGSVEEAYSSCEGFCLSHDDEELSLCTGEVDVLWPHFLLAAADNENVSDDTMLRRFIKGAVDYEGNPMHVEEPDEEKGSDEVGFVSGAYLSSMPRLQRIFDDKPSWQGLPSVKKFYKPKRQTFRRTQASPHA
jgi:hypothetical protein